MIEDNTGPKMKAWVSILVILAFFGILGAMLVLTAREKDFPPGVKETLLVLIGVLAGSFKDVIGYWLGSSHSSTLKTELMAHAPGEVKPDTPP